MRLNSINGELRSICWLGKQDKLPILPASNKFSLEWRTEKPLTLEFFDDFSQHLYHAGYTLTRSNNNGVTLCNNDTFLHSQQDKTLSFSQNIQHPVLKKSISKLIGYRKLQVQCKIKVQQHLLIVRDEEQKILTKAFVYQHADSIIFQVVELRGYAKAYDWLSKQLLKAELHTSTDTLVNLLFKASNYQPNDYSNSPDFNLSAQTPAGEVVKDMCSKMLAVARRNEPGILTCSEDSEFLHDYRVALRKVRSLLSLLKSLFPAQLQSQLKSELASVMRQTNQMRDLDVYLLEQDYLQSLLPAELSDGLPIIFADFNKRHLAAENTLKRWLRSPTYQQKMQQINTQFSELSAANMMPKAQVAIKPLINKCVLKHYKKVVNIGQQITPTTPDEEVHELRIECKKLRYLLDFFSELYSTKAIKGLLNKLKRLQKILGSFNDYSVQQESLLAYLSTAENNAALHKSVGALILIMSQNQHAQRIQVEEKFTEFADKATEDLVISLFS